LNPPTPRYHLHFFTHLTPVASQLYEVFSHKENISMILEYLETDLEKVIKNNGLRFTPADVKSWMVMTLRAIDFCHVNFLLHRVTTL